MCRGFSERGGRKGRGDSIEGRGREEKGGREKQEGGKKEGEWLEAGHERKWRTDRQTVN